ncbi:pentapeptide repeat-containing protein [Hyphomonas sp.]|uniref:pentapeptide repeat-containing protein n=1 Tax=Hyphomonas sp. TaxID=87 RepID=UPI0025C54520|nr:pentapeptide repeat-containing protein [Hyphomonas sp.]
MELGLAELRGAQIERQDFLRADLSGRDLAGAVFRDCELRVACLDWANLEAARFDHARLMSATFRYAHLRGASLRHASLKGADLSGACLIGADLTGATLRQANLSGANLCGADCRWSDGEQLVLAGALYDGATILPPAFRPHEYGMIRRITAGRA